MVSCSNLFSRPPSIARILLLLSIPEQVLLVLSSEGRQLVQPRVDSFAKLPVRDQLVDEQSQQLKTFGRGEVEYAFLQLVDSYLHGWLEL